MWWRICFDVWALVEKTLNNEASDLTKKVLIICYEKYEMSFLKRILLP